MTDILINKVSP